MKSVELHPEGSAGATAVHGDGDANASDGRGTQVRACGPSSPSDAMPGTLRYSATLDRTYEEADPSLPPLTSPTPTDSSCGSNRSRTDVTTASSSSITHDGDFGFHHRTNSVDSLDGSVSSGGGHSRQISSDSTEFIPTRSIKTNAKPAFNPLQFVKTGRSTLVQKAEQQIKQFEEVKKVKERVKEDEEAWQSNLDHWKSKRRQISSQMFPNAEEVKQKEDSDSGSRHGKKSKTFSEMMEERSRRGSSTKLPLYNDWSNEESSDGGGHNGNDDPIAPSKRLDGGFESSESDHVLEDDPADRRNQASVSSDKPLGTSGGPTTPEVPKNGGVASGDESAGQEYTFEKAIQSYTQYAESRTRNRRPSPAAPSSNQANGEWESNGHGERRQPDGVGRSPEQTGDDYRPESNGCANGTKPSAAELSESLEAMKLDRAEGEELVLVVSVRRGADNKDFGFTIKSVPGVGTGIFVEAVHAQSPAESAGLRVDDEILAINGEYGNAKRTYSAIVFAIKQAVYTGCLELAVYRYRDTEFLRLRKPSPAGSPLRAPDVGWQVQRSKGVAGSIPSSRESSPAKVDVVKRRSLFESSASSRQSSEKTANRRSLDVSVNFKDKLASFQSLESAADGSRPDRQKTPERDTSFKEKLASFKSLDSLDRLDRALPPPPPSWTGDTGRQKSFEVLNRLQDDDHRGHQPFERTRSCEFLDVDCPADDGGRADVVDWTPEPGSGGLYQAVPTLDAPGRLALANHDVDVLLSEEVSHLGTSAVNVDTGLLEDDGTSLSDSLYQHASGFELAASLEETAITGSPPNSPLALKPSPVQLEPVVSGQKREQCVQLVDMEQSCPDECVVSDLDSEVVVVDESDVPTKQLEPPKEKPPPPPIEPDDSDGLVIKRDTKEELIRVNSTKRIRKEIWKRRSDFLGIDPEAVQNFIEKEISQVSPPPNVEDLLREQLSGGYGHRQELLRLERERSQLLAKAEFAETGIAVGTGIDLAKLTVGGDDEEEVARKEREIIENLEWEEQQWRREDRGPQTQVRYPAHDSVERDRFSLPREVTDVTRLEPEVQNRPEDDWKLKQREAELQRQEELLRMEKEKLRLEQEELMRQKEEYQRQIIHHEQRSNLGPGLDPDPTSPLSTHSSSDSNPLASPIYEYIQPASLLDGRPRTGPPTKPKLGSPSSVDSETSYSSEMRSSRRPEMLVPGVATGALQPLTKQTLYALSASPKAKLLDGDQWMVARRKADGLRHDNYNQHWLVQEAEFRRLHPQQNGVERSPDERLTLEMPPSPTRPDLSLRSQTGQWNGARPTPIDQQRAPTVAQKPHPTQSVPPDRWQRGIDPKSRSPQPPPKPGLAPKSAATADRESQMLSVSGKKKCSHCGDELGRGAAMIIESLQLFYHINCFKCCVCHVQLGNGSSGADVRVRSQKLHCHNCYSNDEGLKFSKV